MQLRVDREINSKRVAKGSWVDIGRQAALAWIANGTAIARGQQILAPDADCGLVIRGDPDDLHGRLGRFKVECPETDVELHALPPISYPRSLIWAAGVKLRPDVVFAGFGMLRRFEVAVPLYSHQTLAREVARQDERERTAGVIGDLRVPLYEPGVIFARQCDGARDLLAAWQEERQGRADEKLAFLRALWRVKPLLLALPATWIE